MNSNYFIEFLKTLNAFEYNRFEFFVESPYFNKNKAYIKLVKILKPFHPRFASNRLTPEYVYKHVYGGDLDHKRFKLLISDTYKLFKKFLSIEYARKSETGIERAKACMSRNLFTLFDKEITNERKRLSSQRLNKNVSYQKLQIEEILYEYNLARMPQKTETNLMKLIRTTDLHYIFVRLKHTAEALGRMDIWSNNYKLIRADEILDISSKLNLEDYPQIRIYQKVVEMILTKKQSVYYDTKKLVLENKLLFDPVEMKDTFTFLQNFCIQKSNLGEEHFLHELFNLIDIQIQYNVIGYDQKISLADFKNISTVALRIGKVDWMQSFTENYASLLAPHLQNSAIAYNIARIHFHNMNYRATLKQLHIVEYIDVYYAIGSKSLLIKVFFETDEEDLLLTNLQSFTMFLRNEKNVSTYQKQIYLNFNHIIKMLFHIKKGNLTYKTKANKFLEETNGIADLTWVKKKLAEL